MRGLTGSTLVIAGAAIAFFSFYPEPDDRQAAIDRAIAAFNGEPSTPAAQRSELPLVVVDPQRRAFSPQAPLFQQVPRGDTPQPAASPSPTGATARIATDLGGAPAANALTAPSTGSEPRAADGSSALAAADPSAVLTRKPVATGKSGGEEAQRELARNLQKELKRVGCYDGEITGYWTAATRRAMKSFTDRVNATLPVEEPDYILLTLVQGHGAEACGARCPSDQVLAKDGKCLPRAIVAQSEKKAVKRPEKVATAAKPAEGQAAKSPEVGRAIEMWAKVSPDATGSIGSKSAKADSWKTAVIVAPTQPAVAPVTQPVAVVAPLPGRMSVGGPVKSNVPVVSAEAVEVPASVNGSASPNRIPAQVVQQDRPRASKPRRTRTARSYDNGAADAPRRVQVSKAARVRSMHYNLFSRPDRTTN